MNSLTRRRFIQATALASTGGVASLASSGMAQQTQAVPSNAANTAPSAAPESGGLPAGKIGNARISRVLLGGNLISGNMHARDLKYVGPLFRAYVTEEKLMQTLHLAEQQGINTVFETGAEYVARYNREYRGKMQFIPHIRVEQDQSATALQDHIQRQADTGAVALYVWGVAADKLVQAGAFAPLAKAVEMAKKTGLPVGVGGHSLLVPMACEKHQVPCDFYVKTLHSDNFPSATPKPLRKEFIWLTGGQGWYDNLWCINPEETIAFMQAVTKPWIAFKVLAAGAIYPRDAFPYAFRNGADFIAVGMLDFQIVDNCKLATKVIRLTQTRERPWRA